MNIFKYIKDKRYLIVVFLIMGIFMNSVFILDPLTKINKSNIIYINLFFVLIVILYFLFDFFKINKNVKNIKSMDYEMIYGIPVDITEEQKEYYVVLKNLHKKYELEKQKIIDEKNEYSEFIDKWVHDIKTPISVIKLLIENVDLPKDFKKSFEEELKKISENVDRALYYSKLDSFNKDYFIEEVDVYKVIKKVIKDNFSSFRNKKINVEVENKSLLINTDKKWLFFILYQIITNSIKYMGKDGTLKIYNSESEREYLIFIEDNGCGIKKEDINRIFEKGFTGYNGRKYYSSTGIGLYLANKMANKLNLKIEVESEYNVFTKIVIKAPKLNDFYTVT